MSKQEITSIVKEVIANEVAGKKWYTSKTIWVNVITLVAAAGQAVFGVVMPVEYQMIALSLVNLGLRQITHENIVW